MKESYVILAVIAAVVVIALIVRHKEGMVFLNKRMSVYDTSPMRYASPGYSNACEFNRDCLYDSARTIQLSDGTAGVCTLNGLACPSFSKDHYKAKYVGLSPTMVEEMYL